jgi:hypothetical protein
MDPSINAVQNLLDETARECLRYLSNHELTASENRKLAKFIFGCMNQKFELPARVEKRGSAEFGKVLKFIAAAGEAVREIDARMKP